MLMQIKMMKHKEDVDQGRFEQQQGLEEQRFKSLDRYRKAQEKQWSTPATPKVPDWVQEAQALEQYPADTLRGKYIRRALKIKTPEEELEFSKKLIDYKESLKRKGPSEADVRFGISRQDRLDKQKSDAEKAKIEKQWTRDNNWIKAKTKRLLTERERMVKLLESDEKSDFNKNQQPRVANVDRAIAEMDRIGALLQSGQPLPPEARTKATNIITNLEHVKAGVYDFAAGKTTVSGNIYEDGLTDEMKKTIVTSPTTGERLAWDGYVWKVIIKKK
jgi:hypothetical protein